jgi:uroporphyrinogen decarboxylase
MITDRMGNLKGYRIVSFESRQEKAMEKLVQHHGGRFISAPSMQEIPLEKNKDALDFAQKLFGGDVDGLICLTGVGVRTLIETLQTQYPLKKILEALSSLFIVARGPKPVRVLKEYKIPINLIVPEPNTWREILQELDENEESLPLKDKTIAVQEYGEFNELLVDGLKRRGAKVIRVPVYRWALPDDKEPLKKGIQTLVKGEADFAFFMNKVQVEHMMRLAAEEGLEEKLKRAFEKVVVASIGPICSEGLLERGIGVDFEPEHSKMGAFVNEIVKKAKELVDGKRRGNHLAVGLLRSARNDFEKGDSHLATSPFIKACYLEKSAVTPVWFMRQAGRYLKEYRAIRQKKSFLEFCRDKDLVTEITVKAQEFLDADAAIIFADILLILQSMGVELEFTAGEGPLLKMSLAEGLNVDQLKEGNAEESLSFVFDAIRQTRQALKKDIPLLGFAGAPFTLASYMIEGGSSKTFNRTKAFMIQDEARWRVLMDKLSRILIIYLNAQIKAGVQAVQIFDSWVGALNPDDYNHFVKPYTKKVIEGVQSKVPVIHFGTGNPSLLEPMAAAGGEVIGVDYRIRLDEAWKCIGASKAIQGNLDPTVLLADRPYIKRKVQDILRQAGGRPGHIFNLGHGILPQTPPDNARYVVDLVHELSSKSLRT